MLKILLIILLISIILSLYMKSKKNSKFNKIMIFLIILNVFTTFKSNTVNIQNKIYLYKSSDFETYSSYAQESMRNTGVYASITLAQAAIEQGLKANSFNNMFGIKASSSYSGNKKYVETTECSGDDCYKTWAWFRAYDSVADSFTDHGNWLTNTYANREQFNSATSLKDQILSLSRYATAPNYVCTIIKIINKYDLTKYDNGVSYDGRGISITGNQISDLSSDGCEKAINDGEHYETTYSGKLEEGWIYNRLKDTEKWKHFEIEIKEEDIDDSIDEIFNRAKLSYEAYVEEYLGIMSGPGLSAADANGFQMRINMPTNNGIGSQYYFSSQNLSYAGGYTGQCTWYAFGRANEILGAANSNLNWNIASDAGLWYNKNLSKGTSGFKSSNDYTQPKVGAIISWKKTGAPGHVAVVESVNGDNVTISEANISSKKSSTNPYGWQSVTLSTSEINRRWGNYNFSGYIYTVE